MKAILIDPMKREIREVDVTDGDSPACIKELIDCQWFCIGSYLKDGDTVFTDDEGLFPGEVEDVYFWAIDADVIESSYRPPLVGKGLVLGSDKEGCSQSAVTTVDELASAIRWLGPGRVKFTSEHISYVLHESKIGGVA